MYAGWVSASVAVCAGPHDMPGEVIRDDIYCFLMEALLSTTKALSVDGMIAMVMKGGDAAVSAMVLMDGVNTTACGNPKVIGVNIGVRKNAGILIFAYNFGRIMPENRMLSR